MRHEQRRTPSAGKPDAGLFIFPNSKLETLSSSHLRRRLDHAAERDLAGVVAEEDAAGELLRELRAAARDFRLPEDACMSFRALYEALEAFEQDLHQHIHLENNVLFPRAVELEEAAFRSLKSSRQ